MSWLKTHPRELALVLLLAVAYLGFHNWYGLFDVDEAIFTQATREMVANGHYSMPTYNGEPRYQKPPLIYWVQAGFMQLLGESSLWAARLPSALFALASVALLGWGVFRLTGNRTWGWWSAVALGFNLSFVVVARAAIADAVLNFFMLALALWCVRVMYLPPWRWSFVVTGMLTALGLLAKGPVAGIPAALIVLPLLAVRHDRRKLWANLAPFKVLAVTALCLTPWLWLLHQEGMLTGFFTQFVMEENLRRFGPGLTNSQGGNPLFYLGVLALGFMPWVFVLPEAVLAARTTPLRRLRSKSINVALPYLALVWACGILGLFMLSGTKLAHYIVPAYPALAILVGAWLANTKHKPLPYMAWWVLVQTSLLALLLALLPGALAGLRHPELHGWLGWVQEFTAFPWPPHNLLTWEVLRQTVPLAAWPLYGTAALLAVALPWGYTLLTKRDLQGAWLWAGAMGIIMTVIVSTVVPAVWGYTQRGLADLATHLRNAPADVHIITLGMHKPSLLYLSQKPFTKLERAFQLPAAIAPGTTAWVATEQADVPGIAPEMGRISHVEILICEGGYCLVEIRR